MPVRHEDSATGRDHQAIMVVKVSLKLNFISLFAIMWSILYAGVTPCCSNVRLRNSTIPTLTLLNQHCKIWIMPFSWFINVIKPAPENRKRLKLVILRDHICLLDSEIVSVSWSLFMFPWRVRIFIFLENLLHWSI